MVSAAKIAFVLFAANAAALPYWGQPVAAPTYNPWNPWAPAAVTITAKTTTSIKPTTTTSVKPTTTTFVKSITTTSVKVVSTSSIKTTSTKVVIPTIVSSVKIEQAIHTTTSTSADPLSTVTDEFGFLLHVHG